MKKTLEKSQTDQGRHVTGELCRCEESIVNSFLSKSMPLVASQSPAVLFFISAGVSRSEVSTCHSLRPHGLQPTRHLCLRDCPGKDMGVGCNFVSIVEEKKIKILFWDK